MATVEEVNILPGGAFPPGLYIGDEISVPVAGLPAGTRIDHIKAISLYKSGLEKVRVVIRPGRELRQPIFSKEVYGYLAKFDSGTRLFTEKQQAEYVFYELESATYLGLEGISKGYYDSTFTVERTAFMLRIPIRRLIEKSGTEYGGIFADCPSLPIDVITQMCLELYEMDQQVVAKEMAIREWSKPNARLLKIVGQLHTAMMPFMDVVKGALGPHLLQDTMKAMDHFLSRYLDGFEYDEMSRILSVDGELVSAIGRDNLVERFGEQARSLWADQLGGGDASVDELLAMSEKASAEAAALIEESKEKESDEQTSLSKVEEPVNVRAIMDQEKSPNVVVTFKDKDLIIRQEDATEEVYVILDGGAEVTIRGASGVLGTLGKNDFFGYMQPFIRALGRQYSEFTRTASVRATSAVKAIAMTREGMKLMLRRRPFYAYNLITQIQRDIDRASREVVARRAKDSERKDLLERVQLNEDAAKNLMGGLSELRSKFDSQNEDFQQVFAPILEMAEKDAILDKYLPKRRH